VENHFHDLAVERVVCRIGKEIMSRVPGGAPEFDPLHA
jgi:hypothetical protein